jgi:hypothetical protein
MLINTSVQSNDDIDGEGRGDSAKMKNKIMLVGKMSRVFALLR